MKYIRFFFAITLTLSLFFYLNFQQGEIPALGKFMSPFIGFWQNGEIEDINLPSVISSEKLSASVSVKYDKQLVPHIFAENEYDLYFAQGYTTAYHRLWQMEFQIMATEGRISEIIGEKALDYDKTQRRKGLKSAAIRSYEASKSNPIVMNAIQAYSDGVNHRIEELGYADYPIEYKLLDYEPETWTPLKCILLLKYMADMLSSGEADLENTNALKLFGRENFDLLFPETYSGVDPVIPTSTKWNFDPMEVETPDVDFPQILSNKLIDKPDPRNGSNNFAVSASKTNNGTVLLANEPDLSLNLPSIWYVAQLTTPKSNVYGATIPGTPMVVVGFNDSTAWGVTNAKRDVVDWYNIEFRNNSRDEYKYDNKWLKSEKIVERYEVRGLPDVYDTIVYTHYGPVVYDRNFLGEGDQTNLAMKWTAHEESSEVMTFYYLNRAKNYDDYTEALKYFKAPAQNFVFASASGDIAMWVNGRFPVKWKEQGKFLMDGSDSRQEWHLDIPHEQKAYVKNPERGFVSSANQHPVDSTYPYYSYDYNYEFYRNRRINDRLNYLRKVSVEDMMRLQNDNYNYRASESLPLMLSKLDTASLDEEALKTYDLLSKWDYFNETDRVAPSIYEEWWNKLYLMIWDEFENQEVTLIKPHVFNTIFLMRNDTLSEQKFFDIQSTEKVETLGDLINASYLEALVDLNQWKKDNEADYEWYKYKNTRVTHLLKLAPFSFNQIEIGGNRNIVNAASGTHGPSWRMIVELGKGGVRAWGVYPGSQSGNPGNPNYGHMIGKWAKGEYYPLNFLHSKDEENENIIFTQTLDND